MVQRVIINDAYRRMLDENGVRGYGDFLALADGGEQVASSRSGRTHRVRIGGGTDAIEGFLKIHDYSCWRRFRCRRDKGAAEAANYAVLRDVCGVNVPDVIARGWRKRGLRYVDGFILTRAIEGAHSLASIAAETGGAIDDAVMRGLADVVRRMHAASFFHIDLQWRNILVVGSGRDSADARAGHDVTIFLLDSPRGGLQATAVGRAHGRIRDLSSLHKDARRWLGNRVQLWWLKVYLGRARLTPVDRAMIRTILRDREIKGRKRTA